MYLIKTKILNSQIDGKGYFADENIEKGTIVYFYSEDDIVYKKEDVEKMKDIEKEKIFKYAVEDEFGDWIETKTGPYTNHSCNPNIMNLFISGYYTCIAVCDIKKDEEIIIDYSQFYSSFKWSMKCNCRSKNCLKKIGFGIKTDLEHEKFLETKINSSLQQLYNVNQPIFENKDRNAINISKAIKTINKPILGKYIKFSLIESGK